MKTEVYSWRVSRELKSDLEREARRRKLSLSAVLDLAATEWLRNTDAGSEPEQEQQRLRQAAAVTFGSLAGANASRAQNARDTVRDRLRKRYDR